MLGRCGLNKRRITASISTATGCRIGSSSRLSLSPIAAACNACQNLLDTINSLLYPVMSLFVYFLCASMYPPNRARSMFLCSCQFKLIPSDRRSFFVELPRGLLITPPASLPHGDGIRLCCGRTCEDGFMAPPLLPTSYPRYSSTRYQTRPQTLIA
jgi:hypothetical protein